MKHRLCIQGFSMGKKAGKWGGGWGVPPQILGARGLKAPGKKFLAPIYSKSKLV